MFLQYLTEKDAEEKLLGWGALHKNKRIINLEYFWIDL